MATTESRSDVPPVSGAFRAEPASEVSPPPVVDRARWRDNAADALTVAIGAFGFMVGAHDLVNTWGAAQLLAAVLCMAGLASMSRPLQLLFRGPAASRLLPIVSAAAALAIALVFTILKATNWAGTDVIHMTVAVATLPLATATAVYALVRAVRAAPQRTTGAQQTRSPHDRGSAPTIDSKMLRSLGGLVAVLIPLAPLLLAGETAPLLSQPSLELDLQAGTPVNESTRTAVPVRIIVRNRGSAPAVVVGSLYWVTLEGVPDQTPVPQGPDFATMATEAFASPEQPVRQLASAQPGAVEQLGWLIPDHLRIDAGSEYASQLVMYLSTAYSHNPIRVDARVGFANDTLLRLTYSDQRTAASSAKQMGCRLSCLAYVLEEPSWLVAMTRPSLMLTERWCPDPGGSCSTDGGALNVEVFRVDPSNEDIRATAAFFGLRIANARWELLADSRP